MQSSSSFRGGAFNQDWDKKTAAGNIALTERGVLLRTDDGREVLINYGQCELEMGGNTGQVVFCRSLDGRQSIHCDHPEFAASLRQAASGLLHEAVDRMQQGASRRRWTGRGGCLAAAVGAILLLVAAYYGILAGGKAAAAALPRSVDCQVGQASMQAMSLEGPRVNDPVVVGAVEEMVNRLVAHADREGFEFQVTVIDAPIENAFALPGGRMVVYTGLLASAGDAEEVAGVLAHEISHVTLRHGMQRVGQSIGVTVALQLLLGDVNGVIRNAAQMLGKGAINSYSRQQESEADAAGVRLMHAAKLDPLALARFFETMKHDHGDTPGVAVWMSTHPQHQDRIDAVKALVADLPPIEPQPLQSDWNAVRAAIGAE